MQIEEYDYPENQSPTRPGMDVFALAAIAFILFIAFNIIRDRAHPASSLPTELSQAEDVQPVPLSIPPDDPAAIAPPYDQFVVTQGLHGYSYGQMAIDIAAHKGATIKSPISGVVTRLYTDQYGNPTLVIENEIYRVTLLHGKYTVTVGEKVVLGQAVGVESNKGLTTDMQGRSCKGRKCGYHTHINIFDKRTGENVNPFLVLGIH